MSHLLISDIHLDEQSPARTRVFENVLRQAADLGHQLWILGDLFEAWIGDDDDSTFSTHIKNLLKEYSLTSDLNARLMHGNRDFLIGDAFCRQSACTLLPDPYITRLGELDVILSHGDQLCTDDQPYQNWRSQFTNSSWQQQFLAQPLSERRHFAARARLESRQYQQNLEEQLMDVNQQAVIDWFTRWQKPVLIHGHTHRPNTHHYTVDNMSCQRWVLGDWKPHGKLIVVSNSQVTMIDSERYLSTGR